MLTLPAKLHIEIIFQKLFQSNKIAYNNFTQRRHISNLVPNSTENCVMPVLTSSTTIRFELLCCVLYCALHRFQCKNYHWNSVEMETNCAESIHIHGYWLDGYLHSLAHSLTVKAFVQLFCGIFCPYANQISLKPLPSSNAIQPYSHAYVCTNIFWMFDRTFSVFDCLFVSVGWIFVSILGRKHRTKPNEPQFCWYYCKTNRDFNLQQKSIACMTEMRL